MGSGPRDMGESVNSGDSMKLTFTSVVSGGLQKWY
jgi:hypothetical protein